MNQKINQTISQEIVAHTLNVSEQAALACLPLVGKNNKIKADQAATDSMRTNLSNLKIQAQVVIGEGEMDMAPMLYIGEKLGLGWTNNEPNNYPILDIAVDPLEGTNLCANNQPGAMTVIAIAKQNTLLNAPDIYMKKCAVSKGVNLKDFNFNQPFEQFVEWLAEQKKCPVHKLRFCLLDRKRHSQYIKVLNKKKCKIKLIQDGDVGGAILTANAEFLSEPDQQVDCYYGIGGAPEGVLAAAAIKCLGGDMVAQLCPETEKQKQRCLNLKIKPYNKILTLNNMVSDDVVFCLTGITSGEVVKAPKNITANNQKIIQTNSLILHLKGQKQNLITNHQNKI